MNEATAQITLSDAMLREAEALEEVLTSLLGPASDREHRVREAMRYSVLGGGKRLRPFLVINTARLFGVADDFSLRVGAAVEFVHCYSLVHDDLPSMDNDDVRRGKASCHRAFDQPTAILAGDALLALAFEVLGHPLTHSDAEIRCELTTSLATAAGARGMVGGQMLDLQSEDVTTNISRIARIQQLKTGALIEFSCDAGAILGRADVRKRDALRRYSRDLGSAFQIKDDLLDALGEELEVGKATKKDAAAGKATFVALLGIEGAKRRADFFCNQAIGHLEIFGADAIHLVELAEFAIGRQS